MYKEYFGFNSLPFSNTPDPDRFFMGAHYRESLALMIHGVVSRKGLICITGPVGSGKTTLAAVLVRHISEKSIIMKLYHPKISPKDLIFFLTRKFGVKDVPKSLLQCIEIIQSKLIEINDSGKHFVLIIDEAHLISTALFREILILTNLETEQYKLIQIVLIGQKELLEKLGTHELRQLNQRKAVNKTLKSMNRNQSIQYIRHRLKAAGGSPECFTEEAFDLIADFSEGLPRLINKLCDAALLDAFILLKKTVEADNVRKVTADIGLNLHPLTVSAGYEIHRKHKKNETDKHTDRNQGFQFEKKRFGGYKLIFSGILACCLIAIIFHLQDFSPEDTDSILLVHEKNKSVPTQETLNIIRRKVPDLKESKENISNSANDRIQEYQLKNQNPLFDTILNSSENINNDNPFQPSKASVDTIMILKKRKTYPYSILLASFRTREYAEKALQIYKKKGISTYWVKTDLDDKGIWFGVFTGYFENIGQAESLIEEFRLKNVLIKKIKYAAHIGTYSSEQALHKAMQSFSNHKISFYAINENDKNYYLYVGAFRTLNSAKQQCEELKKTGILCKVSQR